MSFDRYRVGGVLTTVTEIDSLMTPIGYQRNLMIYEKVGCWFTDFMRIGVPLQEVIGIVVTLGIVFFGASARSTFGRPHLTHRGET